MMGRRKCRKGKTGYPTRRAAEEALERIYENETDLTRIYLPTSVEPGRCACGSYHLTSRPAKVWRAGKTPRRRKQ